MKNILIVDDDEAIRDVISIILQEADYIVFTASNEKDVYKILKKTSIDLILMDYWLNDSKNGEEISRNVSRAIPVIIVTAVGNTKSLIKRPWINDYLEKPFEILDLLNLVKKHL